MSRKKIFLVAAFLAFNGFFVAKVPQATRPELAGVSALFVLVLWFPGALALRNWLGWKRAAQILLALGVFAVGIETLAIKTGIPYGHFHYGEKIGVKWFGLVPWTVPFSWPPLVLGAMALSRRTFARKNLIAGAIIFLLLIDFLLDPGAVQQEFWSYDNGGFYYGVPLSNFFGWIVSGAIGAWIFRFFSAQRDDIPPDLVASLVPILAFWTSVCAFVGLTIPAIFGAFLLILCWKTTSPKNIVT